MRKDLTVGFLRGGWSVAQKEAAGFSFIVNQRRNRFGALPTGRS